MPDKSDFQFGDNTAPSNVDSTATFITNTNIPDQAVMEKV